MAAFKLTELRCNLFHAPLSYSLAHAVSADLNSIKGTLAWQFTVIFGQTDDLSKQQIYAGNVAALEDNSRFIYFLVTKESLYEQTEYGTLQAALICMREHMRNHGIDKVAMPRICCGNENLNWQKVKSVIHNVFEHEHNVEILICELEEPVRPATPKCQIIEVKGDLFTAPESFSIVQSVSADFDVAKGEKWSWHLRFAGKLGQVEELMKLAKRPGNVAVLRDNRRFIYNLITKERNHEQCTYSSLYSALVAMQEHMHEHHVTKLAIPRLGCGNDRLDWLRVKQILEYVFVNDNVEIMVYFHEAPIFAAAARPVNVRCPSHTRSTPPPPFRF